MGAANPLPYLTLHVDDYLSDPAVMLMDAEAEGCYIRLLFRSWRSHTPGRIRAELVRVMGDFWRCHDRQKSVEIQVARAFDTESEPGWWLQKRLIIEYRKAVEKLDSRRRGADVTNEKRWASVAKRSLSDRSAVGNIEVDVEVDSKDKTGVSSPSVTAACLARMRKRFPSLDLAVVEAKMLSHHAEHPFKNLDRAFINWCKAADSRGIDLRANEEAWVP